MPSTDNSASRRRWLLPFIIAALMGSLWLVPSGGADCSEIAGCRSSVALDVGDVPGGVDDWETQDYGMTLSPDESEVAVVLWSRQLFEHRLAVFSTTTGELLVTMDMGDADYIANVVYSNDGSRIAAATATLEADTLVRGETTIWDRRTKARVGGLWSWTDHQSDEEYYWSSCFNQIGFSNDGRYLGCGTFAIEIETGDAISTSIYEPGFNTLPSGFGYTSGRTVYDVEFTPSARVRLPHTNAQAELITTGYKTTSVVELGREQWHRAAVALDGDSSTALIARRWGGSFIDRILPRFTRPSADLTIARMDDGTVLGMHDLSVEPAILRFSPSGQTFGLLTTDLSLWLFDSP